MLIVETADMLQAPLFTAEALLRAHGNTEPLRLRKNCFQQNQNYSCDCVHFLFPRKREVIVNRITGCHPHSVSERSTSAALRQTGKLIGKWFKLGI